MMKKAIAFTWLAVLTGAAGALIGWLFNEYDDFRLFLAACAVGFIFLTLAIVVVTSIYWAVDVVLGKNEPRVPTRGGPPK